VVGIMQTLTKLIIVFFLCLCAVSASADVIVVVQPGSTCDTSSVIFWWRAEEADFSGTNGTLDYAAVDDTAALQNEAAINTDAVKIGTNGLDCPLDYNRAIFTAQSATIDDEGRMWSWIYINTWVDNATFFILYDDTENFAHVEMNGTDEIEFYWEDSNNARTSLITTTANLSTGTWYFLEAAWKTSTNYRELFIDGNSVGSSNDTIGSFVSPVIETDFGNEDTADADLYMDNMGISTDSTTSYYGCRDETEWPN